MGSSSSKKKGSGSYPKQEMSGGDNMQGQTNTGYIPQQNQGYPPQQQMGYPPQQQGYPPQQQGYPPQQQGYPPQQQGYPPQEQMGYPPQQGFPPQQDMGYPQQNMGYPPQQDIGYPPQGFDDRQIDDVDRHDSACQYQFQPGDETYRCMQCEITDDCPSMNEHLYYSLLIKIILVLCRNCFDASEHKNHQYEMLRDEGGGWCDCGDRTAWREPFVFCRFHAPKYNQQQGGGLPPAGYPSQMQRIGF